MYEGSQILARTTMQKVDHDKPESDDSDTDTTDPDKDIILEGERILENIVSLEVANR